MRYLIFLAVAGFFIGVFARSFFVFSPELMLLFLVLSAASGALFYFGRFPSRIFLNFALLAAAFTLGILRYDLKDSRENLVSFYEKSGTRVSFSGTVVEDPLRQEKFTRAVFSAKGGSASGGKILLTLPHYPEIKYGDILEVEGKLREPENFSDFDWEAYLAKDNIYFEMFLPEITSRKEGSGFWLKKFLFEVKHLFLENLSKTLPEPHSALMAGLTAGERAGFPQKLEDDFRKVGVIHIMVLSGYNISIVADNFLKFLGWFPLSRIFRVFLASFAVILFALMTGASSTVARAAIMGILLLWARESGKVYQALSALIFAAFLMVLFNPKILRFDPSFQLSFAATLGLIVLVPRIEKYFSWFPNFWRLREHLVSTISTQIFVLPLLLSLGGAISPVSIPANLLILTAVPVTMFFGFLTGLAGFLSYGLSQIFSWPAYLFLAYELWVVSIFSSFL